MKDERGFVLVVVIIFLALLSLSGLVMLSMIESNQRTITHSRRHLEAKNNAESGAMAMLAAPSLKSSTFPEAYASMSAPVTFDFVQVSRDLKSGEDEYVGKVHYIQTKMPENTGSGAGMGSGKVFKRWYFGMEVEGTTSDGTRAAVELVVHSLAPAAQ